MLWLKGLKPADEGVNDRDNNRDGNDDDNNGVNDREGGVPRYPDTSGNDDDDKGRVNDPDDTLNGGILDFLLHFYLSPDRLRLRGNLADVVMMSTMRLRMMLVRMEVRTVMMVMDAILPTSVFMSNSPRPWM